MNKQFNKADLDFLVAAMDAKFAVTQVSTVLLTEGAGEQEAVPGGSMSVPKPVTVDVNGDMTADDYKACSMVMAVCQNMVQKSLTDAATAAGVSAADALKNMDAWVQAYVDFPFPFFTFIDTQSNTYKKDDFSLTADSDTVENIVNIKNVDGLKEAVIGALKASGGDLASQSETDTTFNYFGVITSYSETGIQSRVIKYAMHMHKTVTKSLCVTYEKTSLDSAYDTYQFTCDKDLMIKMQAKMGDQLVDYMASKLLEFVEQFYDGQLANYKTKLQALLKQPPPVVPPAT